MSVWMLRRFPGSIGFLSAQGDTLRITYLPEKALAFATRQDAVDFAETHPLVSDWVPEEREA